MSPVDECSQTLAQKIEAAVKRFLAASDSDVSDDESDVEEEQISVKKETLGTLQESKLASINMQAAGFACLQSIVFKSPSDASVKNMRRLGEWPAEVSSLKNFCMELHKPRETGFDMLACILKYSPRAWHQTEKFRVGLRSIAKEFEQSFVEYTANVNSEAEQMYWLLAYNFHAKRRGLRCWLKFTPAGHSSPRTPPFKLEPKRRQPTKLSDGEEDELCLLYQSIAKSYDVSETHKEEVKKYMKR